MFTMMSKCNHKLRITVFTFTKIASVAACLADGIIECTLSFCMSICTLIYTHVAMKLYICNYS